MNVMFSCLTVRFHDFSESIPAIYSIPDHRYVGMKSVSWADSSKSNQS